MKLGRSVVLVIGICFLVAPIMAYATGGNTVPITECNDGVDNDGDSDVDAEDPGCNRPYWEDDSEENIYDMDALSVFSNIQPSDSESEIRDKILNGPSIFYGWALRSTGSLELPDEQTTSSAGNSAINLTWIEGSKDEFGGGTVNWTVIERDSTILYSERNSPYVGLVDHPWPGSCGDGVEQSGETTLKCPLDKGLPSQTKKNIGTVSDEIIDKDGAYPVTVNGDPYSDKVIFDVGTDAALMAQEYTTEGASSCDTAPSQLEDTECEAIGADDTDQTITLPMNSLSDIPDFGISDSGTAIYAIYPEISTTTIEETVNDHSITSSTVTNYTSAGTANFGCEGCSTDSGKECRSRSSTTTTVYDTVDGYKLISYDSQKWTTAKNGNWYTKDTSPQPMTLQVKHDDTESSSAFHYDSCTEETTYTTSDCAQAAPDWYCNMTDQDTYYTDSSPSIDDGVKDHTTTFEIETVSLTSEKIFDLDPGVDNEVSLNARQALFHGVSEFSVSDVISRSFNSKGWFAYKISHDGRDQGNDQANSITRFTLDTDSSGDFISQRADSRTFDADGPKGYSDGFIAISEGSIVGSTNRFLSAGTTDGSSATYISNSDVQSQLDLSCPGDYTECVASIDVNLTNFDRWGSTDPNSGISFHMTDGGPYGLGASLGVCKMYQHMYQNDPSQTDPGTVCTPDEAINYDNDDDDNEVCGDETGEYDIYMEGPEVNDGNVSEYVHHYRTCLDTTRNDRTLSACNLKGETVPEGYAADIAPDNSNNKYEAGGNNPDRELCLDLEGTGIGDEGDSVAGDNRQDDLGNQDYGGEWYDLDSEMAQEYLRGPGSDLITNGDPQNSKNVAYYWNSSLNPPQNDNYNPQGGRAGTALEDDCGNPRFDGLRCDDQRTGNDRGHGATNTFFSFFQEGLSDEDFNPLGQSNEMRNLENFTGVVNRMAEMSNQLEPGMDTTSYDTSEYSRWNDTRGGDYADEWAISLHRNWSIASTGKPYPPYSAWYLYEEDIRTSISEDSISKMAKAFGNSYSAVANESFTGDSGNPVREGEGVWIDPDDMKAAGEQFKLTPEGKGWRAALSREDPFTKVNTGLKIDLTGKDAGLAMDVSSNAECLSSRSDGGCKVMATDIHWEESGSGGTVGGHEKPMCGDDRQEYLIEKAGESSSSKQYSGPYACSNSRNSCFDGDTVREQGAYADTNEPGEQEGRLKNDEEICQKVEGQDDYALWYDQDYKEDYCDQNTVYGPEGVRWFDASYVAEHPQAVSGGIDDSWNSYLGQINHKSYQSDPSATASEVTEDGDTTPVPTGTDKDVTATLGFCGGDDQSEYLVTQECNTRYCETDRTVQGVAKIPGSCVIRDGQNSENLYETDVDGRQVFQPGDRVELTNVGTSIACFNGAWFSDWPISFDQDDVDVPLGATRTASFSVVNIENTETTFRVTMEESDDDPGADQFASFVEHSGDSFTTTIEPTSSRQFRVRFTGGNANVDNSDLYVRAEGINSGISGSDFVQVSIDEQTAEQVGESAETRDVPGIQSLQMLVLVLISTLLFYTRQ